MIFSGIEEAVISGRVDCGVIIHEGRFTYRQKGLVKLVDLGEYWEKETGAPIPLGGIVMRGPGPGLAGQDQRAYPGKPGVCLRPVSRSSGLREKYSQEMDEGVMRQHIDLYVNGYSLSLGRRAEGRRFRHSCKPMLRSVRRRAPGLRGDQG